MQLRLATVALAALLAPSLATAQVYRSVDDSTINATLSPATSKFLTLPGIFTDFVRVGGGQFVELPDGTARLTGRVFAQSNLYAAFLVDMVFTGRVETSDPSYPPAGAPNQGLFASAYTPIGSIDTGTFVYYTGATGTLTGVRNMAPAILTVAAVGPVQIGNGANNRNENFGLFGEFAVTVVQNPNFNTLAPTANAELSLDFVTPYAEDATHPQVYNGNLTNLTEGRGMTLPGLAEDYVFIPEAAFVEANDGTATMIGSLARVDDLDDGWDLTLTMSGRVDPGQVNHPPVGSPVQQLLPTAYVAGGGTLDPAAWHYYTMVTGTLTGKGQNAGGAINLVQTVASQVGGGANNTNTYSGYYGAFAATIVTQPTGSTIAINDDVEIFTLNAHFPVIPFPSVTVPATLPSLPTITDQGFILEGNNFAWIEQVGVDSDIIGQGGAEDYADGWFTILDNTHIEVHTLPTMDAGTYNLLVYNPAIQSNSISVELTVPTAPALYAQPTAGLGDTLKFRMHHGPIIGPSVAMMALSNTLAPSVYPGIVDLDLGNNFTDFVLDPSLYNHNPSNGVAEINYGPIQASLLGITFYFQGMVIDIGQGAPPFAETNHWQIDLQ